MIAWLIMWEAMGDHAAVASPYVDIVSARKSESYIKNYLQRLHDLQAHSLAERADFSRYQDPIERPYPVERHHTQQGVQFTVGHNPILKARKVTILAVTVDEETEQDVVTWEPYR